MNNILATYRGCEGCPLYNEDCQAMNKQVKVSFIQSQFESDDSKEVEIFEKGEVVQGSATIKDDVIYCVSVDSRTNPGSEVFIDPNDVEIIT
ncbi:MAG: hypothetical protein Q8936_11685 [Bacillota bacterium]|nr:hypothetical protein [Bacillota bacterium]